MPKYIKFTFLYLLLSLIFVKPTYAWIGTGIATLKGTETTNGPDLSEVTAYAIEWSSSQLDTDFYTHDPAGAYPERVYVDVTGDYLVAVTIPFQTGGAQREQVQLEVFVNGTAAAGAISGPSYIRNTSSADESTDNLAVMIPNLSAGDYIEVYTYETGITSTVTVQETASLYIEHIASSRTVFSGTATQTTAPSSATNLNQSTAYELKWSEVRKDSGFTHSNVTNPEDIQLDSSGYYLVTINVPVYDSSGTDRQSVLVIPQLDGTTVPGGNAKQGYLRDQSSYNDYSSVHWFGLVYAASNNQVLTVQTQQNASGGTTTVPAGKSAAVFVEKLNDSGTNLISLRGTDLTGGTDWNVDPAQSVEWETNVVKDSSIFTHSTSSNPHEIEVERSGDYMLYYNDSMGTSTLQRIANKIFVEVDGTGVAGAQSETHYIRGGTYNHYESSTALAFLLEDLKPNQKITVNTQLESITGTLNDNQDALLTLWYKGRAEAYTSLLKYRWRNDTTDLNTSGGWVAAEDTIFDSAARNSTYRLRMAIANVGDTAEAAARTYELQFAEKVTTCEDISSWTGVGDTSDDITMYATAHITPDGQATTYGLLTNPDNFTYTNGEGRETADTTGSIGGLSSRYYTELEYSIRASASAAYNTTYCFRLYDTTAAAPIDDFTIYPELQIRTPNIDQNHFRWRDDSTDLNTSGGWKNAEDTDPESEIPVGSVHRLRLEIANTGSIPEESAHTYELQFGEQETSCAAITAWTGVADATDGFEMVDTSNIDPDGESTSTGLLANSEGYTYIAGEGRDTADTTGTLTAMTNGYYRELEFSIAATASASPGKTYCFRLVDDVGELEEYSIYPTLTIEGGFKVQKIIGSITGTLSKTEAIPNPISSVENAFLFFDFTGGASSDSTPGAGTCTAYISSTSEITVEKSTAAGTCMYAIYVVEALRNEFIVRGRGSIALAGADLTNTGTANNLSDIIDTNKIFIPGMSRSDGNATDEWRETYTTLELTDSTTVTAARGDNTGTDVNVVARYEVVEFLASGVSIQTDDTFLDDLGTTDYDVTLGQTIDTSRSFVYTTFRHVHDGLLQTSVRNWIKDSNTLSFDRAAAGAYDSYARWWVIEFPSSSLSVQRSEGSQASPNDIIEVSLATPVTLGRAFPVVTQSNSGAGNAFPRGRYYSDLDGSDHMTLISGYSGNTEVYAWQVVDTSGFVADKYNFTQNDFVFFESANSVTLSNNWPPGSGEDLAENEALLQFPASTETLDIGDQIRLQMNITVNGSTMPATSTGYKLQYRASEDCTTTTTTWSDVGAKGSGEIWRLFDESSLSDSTTQVNNISTSDSSAEGYYSEINPSANNPNPVAVDENTEWDWPLENNGATASTSYCFRMILDDGRTFGGYRTDSFPKITTAPGIGDLMRHGKFFKDATLKGYFWAN